MRKRRSTVMVSPGKDVTLYIPTDTPPEVIAHMNRLKADGIFSSGIMEILTKHILQEQSAAAPGVHGQDMEALYTEAIDATEPGDTPPADYAWDIDQAAVSSRGFSLDEIFRQAGRNAGKLLQETDK